MRRYRSTTTDLIDGCLSRLIVAFFGFGSIFYVIDHIPNVVSFFIDLYELSPIHFWIPFSSFGLVLFFVVYTIYFSRKNNKEKETLKKSLADKTAQIQSKESEILSLQKELEALRTRRDPVFLDHNRHADYHARAQLIVNSWKIRYPVTEFRACSANNVSDPIKYSDKFGVYRFNSLNTKGASYDTTLLSCTCPSFNRTDDLQMRPCKHMIRLAIHLNLYTNARFNTNKTFVETALYRALGSCVPNKE